VIDPVGGTPLRRAASKINGGYYQYLHALDVRTLRRNSMAGQHPGDDGRDGLRCERRLRYFPSEVENQRPRCCWRTIMS